LKVDAQRFEICVTTIDSLFSPNLSVPSANVYLHFLALFVQKSLVAFPDGRRLAATSRS
jgi:hypothetical protein